VAVSDSGIVKNYSKNCWDRKNKTSGRQRAKPAINESGTADDTCPVCELETDAKIISFVSLSFQQKDI